jgi:hypothetical protein
MGMGMGMRVGMEMGPPGGIYSPFGRGRELHDYTAVHAARVKMLARVRAGDFGRMLNV